MSKPPGYSSIVRVEKLSTPSDIVAVGRHNSREHMPGNADLARKGLNRVIIGGSAAPLDLFNKRLEECGITKVRSNGVMIVDCIMTCGKPFFSKVDEDVWVTKSIDYLGQKFGKENLIYSVLHKDEKTPHLHVFLTPIVRANDRDGKKNRKSKRREFKLDAKGIFESMQRERDLDAKGRYIGNPTQPFLHKLQRDYYRLCKALDPQLSAPLYNTRLLHKSLAEWNKRLVQPASEVSVIHLVPNPKPHDLENPNKYAADLGKLISEKMRPMAQKAAMADYLEAEVEELKDAIREVNRKHEEVYEGLKTQNRQLTEENKNLNQRLRAIPTADVMFELGYPALKDGTESLYQLADKRVIKLEKEAFHDITGVGGLGKMAGRQRGKGAIDLLMFVTGWELDAARRWLVKTFSIDAVMATEAVVVAEQIRNTTTLETIRNDESQTKEFLTVFSRDTPEKWPVTKQALTEDFCISERLVNQLRSQKRIGVNPWGDVVWVNTTDGGVPVGKIVSGLLPHPKTGDRFYRESGRIDCPFRIGPYTSPTIALVTTPIEALSYYELFGPELSVICTGPYFHEDLRNALVKSLPRSKPLLLAYDTGANGEKDAKYAAALFGNGPRRIHRHRPPKSESNRFTWNGLLQAIRKPSHALMDIGQLLYERTKETFSALLDNKSQEEQREPRTRVRSR